MQAICVSHLDGGVQPLPGVGEGRRMGIFKIGHLGMLIILS